MAATTSNGEAVLEKQLGEIDLNKDKLVETPSVVASLRKNIETPLKTPLVDPVESATIPTPTALTEEQETKYATLLETVKSWKEIPSTKDKAGPINESEIMWLTKECLLRYLRATKWNTADAAKRLLATLTWRREYGVEELTADYVGPENETGKQMVMGYDIAARPCHYMSPGLQNTQPSPRQVQHLVYMLERVIEMTPPGQDTLALLINFKQSKNRSNTAPGIGQGREVLNILQTHYPERLGRALIINGKFIQSFKRERFNNSIVPWVVWGFFKLITPFIDPLTKEKLKFNEDMRQHVPPEQLWTEFLGDLEFTYEHEVYWPALEKLCAEKHAEQKERWVKAGKHYGESELYLKGGDAPSVGIEVTPAQEPESTEKGKENEIVPETPEITVVA
jgi:hypothetical protein